jgi:pyruvate dehydrogenase E1 component alpha subunit
MLATDREIFPVSLKRNLLFRMKRIRHVEEEIARRYSEQKMRCPTHLSIGQEAVAAAVGTALNTDDFAVSTHRAHAHYLGKGGGLKEMLAEIYGKATGCSAGMGGSMHLIDVSVGFMGSTAIVGSIVPVGVGLSLSFQLRKTDQVSCVFVGDGAVEEGVFYESVNFCAVRNLPVLFVCENNLYSVYSPMEVRQPKGREIHRMVAGMGLTTAHGDGNDVLKVYEETAGALKAIRAGQGPQFLEFATYRWLEHCGPNYDNDIGYRSEEEFLAWKARDPIARFEADLDRQGVLASMQTDEMIRQIEDEVALAFEFAETSPFPDPDKAFAQVFKQ